MAIMVGFQQDADGTIRIRSYTQVPKGSGFAASGSFDFQIDLTVAQWNAILVAIGTGTGGAQTGTADTEVFTPGIGAISQFPSGFAGQLPPNLENV